MERWRGCVDLLRLLSHRAQRRKASGGTEPQPLNLFALDRSIKRSAGSQGLADGWASVWASHHAIFSEIACGTAWQKEPAARACALVGEYDALPGLDATTRRQRHDARAAARPWRLDVGCPSSWRPSRGSRSRVLGRGETTKSRAGHGVAGLCRAQPTEATRRRAGEGVAPITSAPRLDLDSQARDHCCLFVMVT